MTTGRSSSPRRSAASSSRRAWRRYTSSPVRRGRTDTRRASTAGSAMNCSARNRSPTWPKPSRSAAWWQNHYNHRRPHSSLDYQPPARFAADVRRSLGTPPLQLGAAPLACATARPAVESVINATDSHLGWYIVFRQAKGGWGGVSSFKFQVPSSKLKIRDSILPCVEEPCRPPPVSRPQFKPGQSESASVARGSPAHTCPRMLPPPLDSPADAIPATTLPRLEHTQRYIGPRIKAALCERSRVQSSTPVLSLRRAG